MISNVAFFLFCKHEFHEQQLILVYICTCIFPPFYNLYLFIYKNMYCSFFSSFIVLCVFFSTDHSTELQISEQKVSRLESAIVALKAEVSLFDEPTIKYQLICRLAYRTDMLQVTFCTC